MKNLITNRFSITALLSLTVLSGCATVIKGDTQKVFLRSDNPETVFYVDGKRVKDGANFFNYKKGKNYTVKGEVQGCKDVVVETENVFDNTSLLGFVLAPVTVPVDLYTGAAFKPQLSTIVINPICEEN